MEVNRCQKVCRCIVGATKTERVLFKHIAAGTTAEEFDQADRWRQSGFD